MTSTGTHRPKELAVTTRAPALCAAQIVSFSPICQDAVVIKSHRKPYQSAVTLELSGVAPGITKGKISFSAGGLQHAAQCRHRERGPLASQAGRGAESWEGRLGTEHRQR